MQATAGTPRPWTFSVSRQVSWLAGRRASSLPGADTPVVCRRQLAADSCGGSAGIPPESGSPASLLATKSCEIGEP